MYHDAADFHSAVARSQQKSRKSAWESRIHARENERERRIEGPKEVSSVSRLIWGPQAGPKRGLGLILFLPELRARNRSLPSPAWIEGPKEVSSQSYLNRGPKRGLLSLPGPSWIEGPKQGSNEETKTPSNPNPNLVGTDKVLLEEEFCDPSILQWWAPRLPRGEFFFLLLCFGPSWLDILWASSSSASSSAFSLSLYSFFVLVKASFEFLNC